MEQGIREVLGKNGRLGKPISDIKVRDNLHDAGLTSLATVNVMLALEDKFDVEFPDDYLTRETFESISSLMKVITTLQSEK